MISTRSLTHRFSLVCFPEKKVKEEPLKAHDYSMKTGIRVLLLTLVLSSCTDYPTNEYSRSGYYGPPSYYPEPNGYPGSGYYNVPHHTIPNPMVTRAPVGKWLPVIAETVATESKGLIPVSRTGDCYPGALSGNITWALSSPTVGRPIKLSHDSSGERKVRVEVLIRPGLRLTRYAMMLSTNVEVQT